MGKHYEQLSAEERGTIMALHHQGSSMRAIADVLGRSPSTISRELGRNGYHDPASGPKMGRPRLVAGYDATLAGRRAARLRRKVRRRRKLHPDGQLWALVRHLLLQKWSPEQIACTLGGVSHETVYTALYAMPRGSLRKELISALRHGRGRVEGRRTRSQEPERRGKLLDMVSIHLRPPEADERLLPGHWEGDLILGTRNKSAVGTLVDRSTLFVMLVKMDGRDAVSALNGYRTAFAPLDPELRKTLTYDQGKEMALHVKLAESTGLKIYFADPHSPWQRGICENINGLLRQYLPKGADLSKLSQRELDMISWSMNTRPRKTLGWRTPAEAFFEHCYNIRIDPPRVALGV
jgi:transposase, IS30 family